MLIVNSQYKCGICGSDSWYTNGDGLLHCEGCYLNNLIRGKKWTKHKRMKY